MARRVVEKTQVTYVLEAVKESLKHLGNWGGGDLGGVPPPREVAQQYSLLRRLREYLIRCVESFRVPTEWELSDDDENLLVSCIVHALAGIDRKAADRNTNPKDRAWLVEKRDSLILIGHEMQTKPVERIVHPSPHEMTTVSVLHFLERRFAAEQPPGVYPAVRDPQAGAPPAAPAPRESGVFGFPPTPAPEAAPVHQPPPARPPGGDPGPGPSARLPAPLPDGEDRWEPLDLARVRDPMLRGLVGLDLAAFRRAERAGDHRLEMIHLSSILEGIVLDAKFRIEGVVRVSPMDVLEELATILRPLEPHEVDCLAQLQEARHLLRPAMMRANPVVVTRESVELGRAFVERMLLELGYIGALAQR
jgi:hypothetical protein